jgi:hypothetical protein
MNLIEVDFEIFHHILICRHELRWNSNRCTCASAEWRQPFFNVILNGGIRLDAIRSLPSDIGSWNRTLAFSISLGFALRKQHHTDTRLINFQLS